MKPKYNLAVKVGEYEKNGEKKNRYQTVGAAFEGERGPYILLDRTFNPAGVQTDKNRIMISMFEIQSNDSDEFPF